MEHYRKCINCLCAIVQWSHERRGTKRVVRLMKADKGNYEILFSTSKNTGTQTVLVSNIGGILHNHLNNGRATLQMRESQEYIMIRDAKVDDLTQFVSAIRNIMCGNTEGLLSVAAEARKSLAQEKNHKSSKRQRKSLTLEESIETNNTLPPNSKRPFVFDFIPIKRPKESDLMQENKRILAEHSTSATRILRVKKREDYPIKQPFLESGIQEIYAQSVGLRKIDSRLLVLEFLTVLDLSKNNIKSIKPLALMVSRLRSLTLDGNPLTRIPEDHFLSPALKLLSYLSLEATELNLFPRSILKLKNLEVLRLGKNQLQWVPYNIHLMSSLGELCLRDNQLTFLPFTVIRLRLRRIDISGNTMAQPTWEGHKKVSDGPFPTLMELAAAATKAQVDADDKFKRSDEYVLPGNVPRIVYDILESVKYCYRCDHMAARYTILNRRLRFSFLNTMNYVSDLSSHSIPVKEVLCEPCFLIHNRRATV